MGLLTMMCYYMSLFGFSLSPLPCHIRNTLKLALGVYWVEHSVGQFQLDHIGQFQLDVIRQVQLDGAGRGLVLRVTPLPTIDTNLNKFLYSSENLKLTQILKCFKSVLTLNDKCVSSLLSICFQLGPWAQWQNENKNIKGLQELQEHS